MNSFRHRVPLNRDRPSPGDAFDLIRVHSRVNRLPGYHRHGYMEIFWIVEGRCQHLLNERSDFMETGDMCFLRPEIDCHQLIPADRTGFAFINFVLPTHHYTELCERHPSVFRGRFPPDCDEPTAARLSMAQVEALNTQAEQLFHFPNNAFHAEAFLFSILQQVSQSRSPGDADWNPAVPDWLTRACTAIREQEYFCRGTQAFVDIAGRCAEHVARTTRKHLGLTPIQIVNDARMQYARKQLLMTHQPIETILHDCGFEDPSQFYKLFRKTYGESPVRFRKSRLMVTAAPPVEATQSQS